MKSESVSADYAEYGEETLVDRARTGDMIACAALMRRYNQRLYRAIRSVLKTGSDVEDTMQDTYVAVLRNLEQFEGRAPFGTWLLKIGTNAALARMRKQMRVVQLDELPDLDDLEPMLHVDAHAPHTPEQQVSNSEMVALVEEAIDRLPYDYRQVFMLRIDRGARHDQDRRGARPRRGRGQAAPAPRARDAPGRHPGPGRHCHSHSVRISRAPL